jgi:hypothetical protein
LKIRDDLIGMAISALFVLVLIRIATAGRAIRSPGLPPDICHDPAWA